MLSLLTKVAFAAGCALLLLNLYGETRSLRSPHLAGEMRDGDLTLSYADITRELDRRPGESDSDYIQRSTLSLNKGMAHYWGDRIDRYNLRVPLWENYLLHLGSYVLPSVYRRYEFADPDKGLERGVGLCSQHAMVLTGMLERAGVDSTMQALDGHVVVRANDERGAQYIADADYGVVIPGPIQSIEQGPEIVRPYYQSIGLPEWGIDSLVAIYGSSGNRPMTVPEYFTPKIYRIESWSYVLKWAIPLLLMVPFLVLRRSRPSAGAQ